MVTTRTRLLSDALAARLASTSDAEAGTNNSRLMTPALVRAAIDAALEDLGLVADTTPRPTRIWAGAVTDGSFKVCYDTTYPVQTVGLVVSANSDLSSPVFTATPASPNVTDATPGYGAGGGSSYYSAAVEVTGLSADTLYYYAPVLDGEVQTGYKQTVKTFPTAGQAASFTFAFGSCSFPPSPDRPSPVFQAIANDEPAFLLHLGDIDYPDVEWPDIRIQRRRNTRAFRDDTDAREMCKTVPIAYTFDDHDSADNDNHYDMTYASGASNSQIIANTRQAILETTPIYPVEDDRTIAQKFDYGRVRFLVPDLRSQARYEEGTPTALGDGTNPPDSWDQKSWLIGELEGAADDGIKLLFLCSSRTWTGQVFESWDQHFAAEQQDLCDVIRDLGIQVILLTGDCHQGGFDDGTNTDYSTKGDTKFPQLCSSPFRQLSGSLFDRAGPFVWNGEENEYEFVANLYCLVEITDNGGDDISWTATMKGNPIDASTKEASALGAVAHDDIDVEVGFTVSSAMVLAEQATPITLEKSGFGPVAGCSVDWATGTESGTLTFGPNQSRAELAITLEEDDEITLSNPVGCTITGTNPLTVKVIPADNMETASYVTAMDVEPDETRIGVIDDFVTALKSAGVWDKLDIAYLLAAHDAQAARVNLVNPQQFEAEEEGTLTFVADSHYAGDGETGILNTGFSPATAAHFSQDSASIGVKVLTNVAEAQGDLGQTCTVITSRSGTDTLRLRLCSMTTNVVENAEGTSVGFWVVSRTESTGYALYKDGSPYASITQESEPPTSHTFYVCAWNGGVAGANNQYSEREIAFAFAGAGLTAQEVSDLDSALDTYLGAIAE